VTAVGQDTLDQGMNGFGGATPDAPPWSVRRYAGDVAAHRGAYEVDRDRIIHSESFRELQYKTAVRSPTAMLLRDEPPQRFRTRLNHVLEVAQLARGLASAIGATEPLAEAIALAHDLGHSPFGHAGERALAEAVSEHSGETWNANLHSLAVIDEIECSFVGFRGLDPTWALREGVARHTTPFDVPAGEGEFAGTSSAGLESQIVDLADYLAYLTHDLDDALAATFVDFADVAEVGAPVAELVAGAERSWHDQGRRIWPEEERTTVIRRRLIAKLIAYFCAAVEAESRRRLAGVEPRPEAVRTRSDRVVTGNDEWAGVTRRLLELLVDRYYRSAAVEEADNDAANLIQATFTRLAADREFIPERFRTTGRLLDVAAYLASLNDFSLLATARSLGVQTKR
jgi:dGTPase